jgi:glycine/D-amino acid oxidase-like deaminating enzyme
MMARRMPAPCAAGREPAMTETTDIAVIGGGIVGCAVVQHLAELLPRSTRIVLLERGQIAGGTSGCCMGHLMVTPDDAQAYALTAASLRLWRELEQSAPGAVQWNPTGALYLADNDDDLPLLETLRQQFVACGDTAEILAPDRLREREPGLAADIPGALFYAGDGVVLPMFGATAMLRQARQRNAQVQVRTGTEVTGFRVEKGRIAAVRSSRGELVAEHVVLAAGVWTPELGVAMGLPRLPIWPRRGDLAVTAHHTTPVRTQILEVAYLRFAHGAAQVDPTRTDVDRGAHAVNLQPQSNGSCLIGSTRQFAGMRREVNRELLHTSLSRAARYLPALKDAPVVRTWAGLRPYSIDKHPLIGPVPAVKGLYVAAGHEGLGITLAPITGRLIAQGIARAEPEIDPAPYLPARFLQ